VALGDLIDGRAALRVWDAALAAVWHEPPVWFHGDVSPGNLLVENGRLSAVIDFGTCGVGDPSCDLAITWTMFEGSARETYRESLMLDGGTWARGRGWTIWKALIVAAGMAGTDYPGIGPALRVIDDVIEDFLRFER
jgi:aminoglycoside phosphotransferase (APT) family kinase protein